MAAAPKRLGQRIAPICRVYDVNGKTEVEVIRDGMTREEIMATFPSKQAHGYNRLALIKAVVFEAHNDVVEGGKKRELKNFRAVAWYELLFHLLLTTMKESTNPKNVGRGGVLESTTTKAWTELLTDGHITYAPFNLFTKKQNNFHIGINEDSPYPTTILLVEKVSLFPTLKNLADIYGINFVATEGKDSRLAAIQFTKDLESFGVDLDDDFTVYSFADCDPEGWRIPETFIEHLKFRVTGNIDLVRLGVLPSQITESVLKYRTMPYPIEGSTEASRKARRTLYENFAGKSGGVYLTGDNGEPVPARVELDLYPPSLIREKIIHGLAEHLDGFRWQVEQLEDAIGERFEDAFDTATRNAANGWWHDQDDNPRLAEIENECTWVEYHIAEIAEPFECRLSPLKEKLAELEGGRDADAEQFQKNYDEAAEGLEEERDEKIKELEAKFDAAVKALQDECDEQILEIDDDAADDNWDSWAKEINPVNDAIVELEKWRDVRTANYRADLDALNDEEEAIGRAEREAANKHWDYLKDNSGYKEPGHILDHIRDDLGWSAWLVDVGIQELDLVEAASNGESIGWQLSYYKDGPKISKWLRKTIRGGLPRPASPGAFLRRTNVS